MPGPVRCLFLLALVATACASPRVAFEAPAPTTPPSHTGAVPPARSDPDDDDPVPPDAVRASVTRVIDGDTIVLSGIEVGERDARTGGRRARLIGIDTPEVHGGVECLGREASAFTKRTLAGRDVFVDFDVDPIDRYGRALVYVWEIGGAFFNARIVTEGYALPFTVPPNVRYAELFVHAAGEARGARRGLWSSCLGNGR